MTKQVPPFLKDFLSFEEFLLHLLAVEVWERFVFHDMILRFPAKVQLKVKQCPWASDSKQMYAGAFK